MSEISAPSTPDPSSRLEIMAWRKRERERLIAARLERPQAWRADASARIARTLGALLGDLDGKSVSLYWPLRGEPDLRSWMREIVGAGGRTLLPVVVTPKTPLEFRPWREGEPLEKGVWNIPVPATRKTAVPDICLAPVVGFDRQSYRLGYGGGYFDRTLAGFERRPRLIGVGYALQAIETIYPFEHDVPMDAIVTEDGMIG